MQSLACSGKTRRMRNLFDPMTGRTVLSPVDDSLLAGPEGGLRSLGSKIQQIIDGGTNGVLAFPGTFRRYAELTQDVGRILNITASSTLGTHTRKVLVANVTQALAVDADAISVHVNMSSRYEPEMLQILADTVAECEQVGMPVLAMMYLRTESPDGSDDNYYELLRDDPDEYAARIRHVVRVGADLGADIIKTQYTGNAESFSTVVESALDAKVVIAGGPIIKIEHLLDTVYATVLAGAHGIAGGRNMFHRRDTEHVLRAVRNVVHNNMSAAEAFHLYREQTLEPDAFEDDLQRGTTFMGLDAPPWLPEDSQKV